MSATMGVEIRLAGTLRPFAKGQSVIQIAAGSVDETLDLLVQTYPRLKDAIYSAPGSVSPFLGLFVDDEDVRLLGGLGCQLKDGQVLAILPALSGG